MRARVAAYALATLLLGAAVLHVVIPGPYRSIVPDWLGAPAFWVAVSGVAELLCAVGLIVPRLRRRAGWATAGLFVAVFPANVQMALDALHGDGSPVIALLRLPVQVPLVLWAVYVVQRSAADPAS